MFRYFEIEITLTKKFLHTHCYYTENIFIFYHDSDHDIVT